MKAITLMEIFALAIILIALILSGAALQKENEISHIKNITVAGKICWDENTLLNPLWERTNTSKIQDREKIIYFIQNEECDKISIGDHLNISYYTIRQFTPFEDGFPFNRIIEAKP